MRLAGCALAAMFAAMCLSKTDSIAQREERFEVAWTLPNTAFLYFTPVAQSKLPPKGEMRGSDTQVEPACGPVGFFGRDVAATGEFSRKGVALTSDETLLQLAMFMPPGKLRGGANATREWQFARAGAYGDFALTSVYTPRGFEHYDNVMCRVIAGTHALRPGSMLGGFEAETVALFDTDKGFIRGARMNLRAAVPQPVPEGKESPGNDRQDWQVEWRLSRDFDAAHERILDGRVERAIKTGIDRLWTQRNGDGLWRHGTHARGGTALVLLAMLMCDVSADDPRIKFAFDLLPGLPLDNTYDVGVSLMAIEAKYITEEERRSFLGSDKPVQLKRELSPADRAEMERLVKWLADNQNDGNPFWNYSKGHTENNPNRFDFSVTQYALLGLAAAVRCEIRIPPGLCRKLVDQVRDYQTPSGPRMRRTIDYKPAADEKSKPRATYSTRTVEARGWAYASKPTWDKDTGATTAYGSMTAAGLAQLMVGLDIANSMNAEDFNREFGNRSTYMSWERAAQESIESGLCWLEHWFSVTTNPNRGQQWYYYWMYGLERVGMMAGIKHIGERNWYYEGVCPLLALQDDRGGWGNATDTSFALLFLKKGTVPPRRSIFTGRE